MGKLGRPPTARQGCIKSRVKRRNLKQDKKSEINTIVFFFVISQ